VIVVLLSHAANLTHWPEAGKKPLPKMKGVSQIL
jgi:hypothetical protein